MSHRSVLAAVLLCGLAAAQTFHVEDFDRGGLPAKPQTAAERELARRIAGHRTGDVDGAADIQRRLAAYYRGKGDEERAREAERRAAARGAGVPRRTGLPGMYGTVPAPRRAPESGPPLQPAAPVENPAGAPSDIPIYAPAAPKEGESAAPRTDLKVPDSSAPAAPEAPATAPSAAPAPAPDLSGRYTTLRGRTLHTWHFRPDGAFEHTWAPADDLGRANLEAGTYRIAGPYLMLVVLRRLDDGREVAVPAGSLPGGQSRRLRFEAPGARAGGGIMLDGMMLKPE